MKICRLFCVPFTSCTHFSYAILPNIHLSCLQALLPPKFFFMLSCALIEPFCLLAFPNVHFFTKAFFASGRAAPQNSVNSLLSCFAYSRGKGELAGSMLNCELNTFFYFHPWRDANKRKNCLGNGLTEQ